MIATYQHISLRCLFISRKGRYAQRRSILLRSYELSQSYRPAGRLTRVNEAAFIGTTWSSRPRSRTRLLSFVFSLTKTLEAILRSVGHWVIWAVPMNEVPSDPVAAYDGFVREAIEMGSELIDRVHRRFFLDEWNHFVDFILAK